MPDVMLPGSTAPAATVAGEGGPSMAARRNGREPLARRAHRLASRRVEGLLTYLFGAEAIWVLALIGYGVAWVAGAAGSARQEFRPGVGQEAVVRLNVGRFLGFVLPLAGLAVLLGWVAVGTWRERKVDLSAGRTAASTGQTAASTGRTAALAQSMALVQPLVLPALTGAALLVAFDIGLPSSLRPPWASPVATTSVVAAVVLGVTVAALSTVRVRPAAALVARLLTAVAVLALVAGCLADAFEQRALGFSSVGWLRTGRSSGVAAVACPAAGKCMALGVADTSYTGRSPQQIAFAVTRDGGRSWQIRSEPAVLDDVFLPSLTCPSLENCYAVGLTGAADDSVVVDATDDGGRSWHSALIPSPAPAGPRLPEAACLTPARCVMANGEELALTTDSGGSWRVVRVVDLHAWQMARTLISCSGTRRCLVVSAVSESLEDPLRGQNWFELFSTTDGGSRWRESRIPLGQQGQVALSGFYCAGSGECIVSWSSTGNFVSTVRVDGRGFSDVRSRGSEPELFTPVCFGDSCLASGTNASRVGSFVSRDGGRLWSFRAGSPSGPFACWSTEDCVAGGSINRPAGSLATLAWSSDGGRTWHRVSVPVAPVSRRLAGSTRS